MHLPRTKQKHHFSSLSKLQATDYLLLSETSPGILLSCKLFRTNASVPYQRSRHCSMTTRLLAPGIRAPGEQWGNAGRFSPRYRHFRRPSVPPSEEYKNVLQGYRKPAALQIFRQTFLCYGEVWMILSNELLLSIYDTFKQRDRLHRPAVCPICACENELSRQLAWVIHRRWIGADEVFKKTNNFLYPSIGQICSCQLALALKQA